MKLVLRSLDVNYLNSQKILLESNGIPAFVSGENTARTLTPIISEPGLWVFLDEHEGEALQLLDDPDYEVINKVDVSDFDALKEEVSEESGAYRNLLGTVVGWAVVVILGLFIIGKVLQLMAT